MTPSAFDPFRVGPRGGVFSGGVAPGYSIDPLRGLSIGSSARKERGLRKTPGPAAKNGLRMTRD